MVDFTSGHISSEEGRSLLTSLQQALQANSTFQKDWECHPGVSYRNILVARGVGATLTGLKTQAPHDIPNQRLADYGPQGAAAELLQQIMKISEEVFRDHPVNRARQARGEKPATQVWLWGEGRAPVLEKFSEKYGLRGAMITAVDLVRGVALLMGWDLIHVPGATGYLDTDYGAKGRYALEALKSYDIVCVHIEAPDEASHEGRVDAKIQALEAIDAQIVSPLLAHLEQHYSTFRILVEPDHRTTVKTKAHAHGPVPYALAGSMVPKDTSEEYNEIVARTGRSFDPGCTLMSWFLGR